MVGQVQVAPGTARPRPRRRQAAGIGSGVDLLNQAARIAQNPPLLGTGVGAEDLLWKRHAMKPSEECWHSKRRPTAAFDRLGARAAPRTAAPAGRHYVHTESQLWRRAAASMQACKQAIEAIGAARLRAICTVDCRLDLEILSGL